MSSEGINCIGECSESEGLVLLPDDEYKWRATQIGTSLPFVCQSWCKAGYKWYSKAKRCLKIVDASKPGNSAKYVTQNRRMEPSKNIMNFRTFAGASLECGRDNGVLAPMYDCQDVENLAVEIRRENFDTSQSYYVGNIYTLKKLGSRSSLQKNIVTR